MSASLLGLALVLLSLPGHASLSRESNNTSGRTPGWWIPRRAGGEEDLTFPLVVVSGTVFLGSVFMKEALQRAIELTDAAYARTSER